MIRKRDSQRSAMYRWERLCRRELNERPMRPLEIRQLVEAVWQCYFPTGSTRRDGRLYRSAPTVVLTGRTKVRGFYRVPTHEIHLVPEWSRLGTYVLHETAHAIVTETFRFETVAIASHGKEFAGLLIDLYEQWLGLDRATMYKLKAMVGTRCMFCITPALTRDKAAGVPID